MDITLSIVIFAYNHEKYICKCIDSILNQKMDFEAEIIIADDCSTDNTVQVVSNKYGNRVKIWSNEHNVGLCQNIYNTFKKVNGQYIYECAGDDFLDDDRVLSTQVRFLEEHAEYFSVTGWMLLKNEMSGESKIKELPYKEYSMVNFLRGEAAFFSMGVIRNTFKEDQVEYLTKASRNNEEVQMLYYTLKKGKKYILPQAAYTYCYRVGEGLDNYCSTHDALDMLSDYARGFQAIEKWDRDSSMYNFDIAKLKRYESFIDRILENGKTDQILQIRSALPIGDILKFAMYKLIIKMNHRRIPEGLLKEQHLIKAGKQ